MFKPRFASQIAPHHRPASSWSCAVLAALLVLPAACESSKSYEDRWWVYKSIYEPAPLRRLPDAGVSSVQRCDEWAEHAEARGTLWAFSTAALVVAIPIVVTGTGVASTAAFWALRDEPQTQALALGLGSSTGTILAGVLGGLAASTTTLSYGGFQASKSFTEAAIVLDGGGGADVEPRCRQVLATWRGSRSDSSERLGEAAKLAAAQKPLLDQMKAATEALNRSSENFGVATAAMTDASAALEHAATVLEEAVDLDAGTPGGDSPEAGVNPPGDAG